MLPYPRMFKEKDFLVDVENFWYDASGRNLNDMLVCDIGKKTDFLRKSVF